MKSKVSRKLQQSPKQAASAGANGISLAPPTHGLDSIAPSIQRKKLGIGSPEEAMEREADSVAERVLSPRASGADFSNVRVHADASAHENNAAVNARAYTMGRDIPFKVGQYHPAEEEGRRLLAHELTHTIQQR